MISKAPPPLKLYEALEFLPEFKDTFLLLNLALTYILTNIKVWN